MGPWDGLGLGTGIALPATHPVPTPGTPLPPPRAHAVMHEAGISGLNMVVGLKSVAQLSLVTHFSGSQGITEVYNLLRIGKLINHSCIPGTK